MNRRIVAYILPGGHSKLDLATWAAGVADAHGWRKVTTWAEMQSGIIPPLAYQWVAVEVRA